MTFWLNLDLFTFWVEIANFGDPHGPEIFIILAPGCLLFRQLRPNSPHWRAKWLPRSLQRLQPEPKVTKITPKVALKAQNLGPKGPIRVAKRQQIVKSWSQNWEVWSNKLCRPRGGISIGTSASLPKSQSKAPKSVKKAAYGS